MFRTTAVAKHSTAAARTTNPARSPGRPVTIPMIATVMQRDGDQREHGGEDAQHATGSYPLR